MKKEDIKIGMKVKIPFNKNSVIYPWYQTTLCREYTDQKFCYVSSFFDRDSVTLGYNNGEYTSSFYIEDLEPYEEEIMDEKLVKIEKLEKELAELKALVEADKKPKKDWPDSFEEAMEISKYWGMLVEGTDRFMVLSGTEDKGKAVRFGGMWCDAKRMQAYWKCNGIHKASFHKFNSAKELYQWMMEGEK